MCNDNQKRGAQINIVKEEGLVVYESINLKSSSKIFRISMSIKNICKNNIWKIPSIGE